MGTSDRQKGHKRGKLPFKHTSYQAQFDNARLEEQNRVDEDTHSVSQEDSLKDSDEESVSTHRPYSALLESFTKNRPHSKRRKLKHRREIAATFQQPSQIKMDYVEGNDTASNPINRFEESADHSGDGNEDIVSNILDDEDESFESDAAERQQESESDPEDEMATDPFRRHFCDPNNGLIEKKIKALQRGRTSSEKFARQSWRVVHTFPQGTGEGSESMPQPSTKLQEFGLKERLRDAADQKIGLLDDLQRNLAPLIFGYYDLLFNGRTFRNADRLSQLVCLHALNHVFRTRDHVLKGNRKMALNPDLLDLRYQSFTRPRVLFLLPTKNACLKMVNMMVDICRPEQQENRKRFDEGYRDSGESVNGNKPDDYKDLFDGADDDMFRIGLKFTRKTMKFFAPFYASDILFASPLGLRTAIGSEGDKKKKLDYDFLSSIEVVIVDHADALLMQNWDHMEQIFELLNRQPKDLHGCDYNRVHMWYLDDNAKYYRQTIIMSSFMTPELVELMRRHCHNWAGQIKMQQQYPGMIQNLGIKAKQTFSRYDSSSIDKDPEARFNYFISAIVPALTRKERDATGTLIFIPSYLDFVRVRNYFATSPSVSALSFGTISDYTEIPKASRAISHFHAGRHRVLLYTERAHHFRRYVIKGVRRVIMYGLPENPIFYKETAGEYLGASERRQLLEPGQGTVRVIFSKYDLMKLERIVGTQRVWKMITDKGDTFDFV